MRVLAAEGSLQEMLNKAIVSISDLRTLVEENKWENMRKFVCASAISAPPTSLCLRVTSNLVTVSAMAVVVVVAMELDQRRTRVSPTDVQNS